jgi:hypothetical protein
MAKGKLNQLTDETELAAAATNVVVANICFVIIFTWEGVTGTEDFGVIGHLAVFTRLAIHYLEFDRTHSLVNDKCIALSNRAESRREVRFEEMLKEIARQTLNCVGIGKDTQLRAIGTVGAPVNRDNVTQIDTEVAAHNAVHADLAKFTVVVRKSESDGVPAPLALDDDVLASEKLKLVELVLMHGSN